MAKKKKRKKGLVKDFKNILKNIENNFKEFVIDYFSRLGKIIKNLFKSSKNVKGKLSKKNKTRRNKIIGLIFLNLLLAIWLMLGIYITILALYLTGITVIAAGTLSIIVSLFFLFNSTSFVLEQIGYSGLFAGLGLILFGILFIELVDLITKWMNLLSRKYLNWNRRVGRKLK